VIAPAARYPARVSQRALVPRSRSAGTAAAFGLAFLSLTAGCEASSLDPRARLVASVTAEADEPLIRTRPALVASKYAAMRASVFAFYRGSFPLFLHDARFGDAGRTRFTVEGLFPLGVGDAHPENFGALLASDGTFGLEPNDFDGADRYPWVWQLRRLTIGMVLAARSAGVGGEGDIVRATASAYAEGIAAYATGAPRERVEGAADPVLADLFERAVEDLEARSELAEDTVIDANGARRLLRGAFDDGQKFLEDAPEVVQGALPAMLSTYRSSLLSPPPAGELAIKDVAREYGAGVASLARVRFLVLVEGPTAGNDDDALLEVKEIADSGAGGFGAPGFAADSPGDRVTGISRRVWARPDASPRWGTSELLGFTVQIRPEIAGEKGVKLKRLEGDRATPEALSALGSTLGRLLARLDARGSDEATLDAIASVIGADVPGFVEEQASASVAYADVVDGDWKRFGEALDALGPRLGIPVDPADAPGAEVAAIFGAPP